MRIHIADPSAVQGKESAATRCGRVVPAYATRNGEPTCAVCLHADRPRKSVTASYPGVVDVTDALGMEESLVRALARLAGCPKVPGGQGYRFTSVEAFKAWHDAMSLEEKLQIKPYAQALKRELVAKIAKVSWGVDAKEARGLMRKSYRQLTAVLAWWEKVDAEDKARLA